MLYFAYGSNLDPAQMRGRCPSAQFDCVANLEDHAIAFPRNPHTTLPAFAMTPATPQPRVLDLVYEILDGDVADLERREGCHVGAYKRVVKSVIDRDSREALSVETDIAMPEPNPPPPSNAYLKLIAAAACFWRLPQEYIQLLEQFT